MTTTIPVIDSSTALLQVPTKVEEAFRWLLEVSASVVTPNLDAEVVAFAGTGSSSVTFPAIVTEIQGCREASPGAGVWEFELLVHAAVKFLIRQGRAERKVGDLIGGVHAILQDVARTKDVLNLPPAGDSDLRAVQEFHVVGYYVDDLVLSREGRVARGSVTVRGLAHGWDVAPAGLAGRFQG